MKRKKILLLISSVFILLSLLLTQNKGMAQDPGEPDTVYFSCGSDSSANGDTLYIPCNGTHDVTIWLNLHNDEPVQGFQVPLIDECYGSPSYAYLDSAKNFTKVSNKPICYQGGRFYDFSFIDVTYDLQPPQVLYWGIGLAGVDSGNGLLAKMVYTVKDTGRICLDTLRYDNKPLELVDEFSMGYTPIFRPDTFIIAARTPNAFPVLTLPADVDTALTAPQTLCIKGITATDSDAGNTIILEKIEGPGTFVPDTLVTPGTIIDSVCFVPESQDSTYMFVFKLSDECPAEVYDTFYVTVNMSEYPALILPADVDTFLCQAQSLCIDSIMAYDPDVGDTFIVQMIEGPGTFNPDTGVSPDTTVSSHCFTPASNDSSYMFVFRVADSVQFSDEDTFYVTVDMEGLPSLTVPSDVDTCLPPGSTLCIKDIIATDPDTEDTLVLEMVSGPGTFVPDTGLSPISDSICFDPASNDSTYELVFKVTDSCDSTRQDTFYVTVNVNQPPVLTVPTDIDTFLCAPETLCLSFQATDPDAEDTLVLEKIVGPGTFVPDTGLSPLSDSICFEPSSFDSTYLFVFRVTDPCGEEDEDTFQVIVDVNEPPAVTVPSDTSVFRCEAETLCFDIDISDPDNPVNVSVNSPWYYQSADTSVCLYASSETSYPCTVIVTDSCDVADTGIFTVTIDLNEPPAVTVPPDTSLFLCQPQTVCFDIDISDPDNPTDVNVNSPWSYQPADTSVCVYISSETPYPCTVIVTDSCGVPDTGTFQVTADLNGPPVVTVPSDTSIFLCEPENLCLGVEGTDPNTADTIVLEKIEGPGIFTPDTGLSPLSDTICFLPASVDSTYRFIFRAKDTCPAEDYDTFNVTVTINKAPLLTLPEDVDTSLCDGQSLCIYNISATDSDANDTLILEMIEGPGVFEPDTGLSPLSDSVCFTPESTDSTYRFVFRVTDHCEILHEDTFYVTVDINDPPALTLPSDIDTCLSPAQSLCIGGIIATDSNSGDTLILEKVSGPGTFVPDTGLSPLSDTICFNPDPVDSNYKFVFKVTDSCDSSRTDSFYVTVNINEPPVLTLPADRDTFLCDVQELCFDSVIAHDPDQGDTFIVQLIEGPGTFAPDTGVSPDTIDTTHCFTPDKDSTYRFIFEITDPCGQTDRDTFNFTVNINDPPLISAPETLFVIENSTNFDTFTASDPDNNIIMDSAGVVLEPDCGDRSIQRISGSGTSSGEWEFSYGDTGCPVDTIYFMIVDLRDTLADCESKAGYDTILVIIRSQTHYNNPPIVAAPGNTSGYPGDVLQLFFSAADPDSDVISDTSVVFVKPVSCGSTTTERITDPGYASGEWKVTFYTEGCSAGEYWIDLNLQDFLGAWGWDSTLVTLRSTDVPETSSNIVNDFALRQNYPNPFNQETSLRFQIPHECKVSLKIYNLTGRLVRTLVDAEMNKGEHTIFWDGTDNAANPVASGIYFYRLTAADFVSIRKMILLK